MWLRGVYIFAGVFLMANAAYITQHMVRHGDLLLLAGVSPALVGAVVLGVLLILRNARKPVEAAEPEPPPTDPGEDSEA